MPSVRVRDIRAKVSDKDLAEKVRRLRELVGRKYRIVIEEDHISVEGNFEDQDLTSKVAKILAS